MERLMRTAVERHGRLDILYSNAGVGTIRDVPVPLHETEDWVWERTLDVNLRGTFLAARAALPHMLERGGAIVNVASVYALAAGPAAPSYVASKGGVLALTRSIAVDYADRGIRCNVICPGFTETSMVLEYIEKLDNPVAARTEVDAAHLIGRLAKPDEIAAAALWLASDAASFVTGAVLAVDGGYTAR
jgi:dihydroanticapsin dehydrogenase